jgi:hypothetical protein
VASAASPSERDGRSRLDGGIRDELALSAERMTERAEVDCDLRCILTSNGLLRACGEVVGVRQLKEMQVVRGLRLIYVAEAALSPSPRAHDQVERHSMGVISAR